MEDQVMSPLRCNDAKSVDADPVGLLAAKDLLLSLTRTESVVHSPDMFISLSVTAPTVTLRIDALHSCRKPGWRERRDTGWEIHDNRSVILARANECYRLQIQLQVFIAI